MQSDGETSSPFYQVGSREQLSQTLGLSLQLIVVIGINAIHMLDLEGCIFYTVDQYALKTLFRTSGLEVYLYTHTYTQRENSSFPKIPRFLAILYTACFRTK